MLCTQLVHFHVCLAGAAVEPLPESGCHSFHFEHCFHTSGTFGGGGGGQLRVLLQ